MNWRGGLSRFAGPIIVALVGIAAVAWTWRNGPDPVVDFGRELYLPWRLADGDVLYRDINHFNGPLSQYFNAMFFKAFGASLGTLLVVNATLMFILAGLIYWLVREAADDWAATVAAAAFFLLFGCGNFTLIPNYNFLTPYSHELTHGVILSVAAIGCLSRFARTRRLGWAIAVGVLWGLIFLTKAEVFLAASIALVVGFAAIAWISRPKRPLIVAALVALSSAIAPVVIAFALLSRAMSAGMTLSGLAGSWKYLGDQQLLSMPYFKDLDGTANVEASVLAIAVMLVWYAVVVLVAGGLGLALRNVKPRWANVVGVVASAAVAAALISKYATFPYDDVVRPLPLIMAALGLTSLILLIRRRSEGLVLVLTATAFAGCLLAKVLLNAHVFHYGFALSMPATILLVAVMTSWLPRWVASRGGSACVTRCVMTAACTGVIVNFLLLGRVISSTRTTVVAAGTGDAFRSDKTGAIVDAAVKKLNARAAAGQTLVGIPDGMMLNYLARRVNPVGHMQFTPPALAMFNEKRMLADFQAHPPDFIALVHADASTYGARFFGQDYGLELAAWVAQNYVPIEQVGATPFRDERFGILLLQRKPPGNP